MGVAPEARLLGLKVLDKNGKGRTSHVIRAIEFAIANRARFNLHILNLSLGHPILAPAADDPLVQAVEAAVRAGLIVTVSSGNNGTNPDTGAIGYAGITLAGERAVSDHGRRTEYAGDGQPRRRRGDAL